MLCDNQALYDTSTPPASSSPAYNAETNAQQNGMRRRSSGPQTVAELQHPTNDDVSNRRDERRIERDEPDNDASMQ